MVLKNYLSLLINKIINYLLWLLFVGNLTYLLYNFPTIPEIYYGDVLRINGFTILIWTLVTFFSAIISSYGKNYLKGFEYHSKFLLLCLGFTFSIMVFVMSNHVALLVSTWLLMGVFMAQLIGVDSRWGEAREASKFALKYFLAGSFFLSTGVLLLAFQTESITLSGIISNLGNVSQSITFVAALCIIMAAIIQSAIYPFHRWLLSAMTSPTPASALMHAGFVNGSGILLALFSTVLFASNTLIILFVIGGLTAVVAQFTKLLQVNVKQKLACSTIAQMGFMIMQCGLGFFNAAVVHLLLHGFYKAYLFLSAGEEIGHSKPQKPTPIKIKPLQAIIVLFFGILGAFLFAYLTGKGTELNSSIFLTLIVAITVGQATYNIVKEQSLSLFQKSVAPPLLFVCGMVTYALIYKGVTALMSDMPMVVVPLSLSVIEITFGILFLACFFIMKLGIYRNYPWLYAKLLNISQPYKKTVLMYNTKSL
ncbi:MAG: proton-conducting transporter membrane subunit [Flavobacterium sp.]